MAISLGPRRLVRAALLALVALLGPTISAAQELRAPPKPPRARLAAPYGRAGAPHALGRAAVGTVTESEPNDSIPDADAVALGDTVSGVVNPAGDQDFFGFDLSAGTNLRLDVDASQFGSALDPILGLFDAAGNELAFNDDRDGLDSRIEFTITAAGRYYAGITDFFGSGGSGYFYTLKIGVYVPPPPGPGDTTRLFAQGIGVPWGMTAAANGDLFVTDRLSPRVVRVNAAGTVTTFVSPPSDVLDVVIDGVGDLLVAAGDSGVWRVTPAGVRSRFTSGFFALAITVGPDGDVWVGGFTASTIEIRRYDPLGAPKATIDVTAIGGLFDIAFSPVGELYASNGFDGVFRVTTGGPVPVITAEPFLEGLAFDEDGYLYVANGFLGEVHLFDPAFQPVYTPFARTNLGGPINLVFGRDAAGAMTSRLFADNVGFNLSPPFAGGIVAMNPAGMRAPGFRVGITRPQVPLTDVANAFLGASGAVTADVERFLDLQGNNNGRLDVADFRAYLRSINQLPAAAAGRAQP